MDELGDNVTDQWGPGWIEIDTSDFTPVIANIYLPFMPEIPQEN